MLVYYSVIVQSVLRLAMCSAGVSLWPRRAPSWTPMVGQVLREVLTGPLSGYQVTLTVDKGVQRYHNLDPLLTRVASPAILLRPTFTDNDSVSLERMFNSTHSVAVAVVGSESPWPLWSPPVWLSPMAMVVVVVTQTCNAHKHFQSPLLQRMSSVALLCHNYQPQNPEYSLYRVLTNLPLSAKPELLTLGTWHPSTFSKLDKLFYDRFQDFSGKGISVINSLDDAPLSFMGEDGRVDGVSVRILSAIASSLNFTYTYNSGKYDWGKKHENGSWNGMLGEVQRGEMDLVLNYLTITHQRVQEFDYSISYFTEGFGVMLRVPPPLPLWRNVLYPYTGFLWAAVGGAVVLATFAFYFVNFNELRQSLLVSFLTVLQSLMSQSVSPEPQRWISRGLLGLWLVSTWLLRSSYTCNLVAVLTVIVVPSIITSLEHLEDSHFRLCMVDYGEFVPEALVTSTDPTLASLGAKLDLAPTDNSLAYEGEENCVEMVVDGTHAHVETFSYLQLLYQNLGHGGHVYHLKQQLYLGNLAFFFTKHTPWKYKFDVGMQRLVEAGLVRQWYSDLMQATSARGMELESRQQAFSLPHLLGPFLLLMTGSGLATLAFMAERLYYPVTSSL